MDQNDNSQLVSEGQSNLAKKFQLETQIRATMQGERNIEELYDFMIGLWDQMAKLEPNDLTNSNSYKKHQEEQRIVQFLMALSDEFKPSRKALLSRCSVPCLEGVVNELKIVESRLISSNRYSKGKLAVENDDAPLSNFSSLSVDATESPEPAFAGEDSDSSKISTTFKIMTYNVCFWALEVHERMRAFRCLVQLHSPDIICLQEVTSYIYAILMDSTWWNSYQCSRSYEEALELGGSHFCIQLSKLPVKSFSRKPFENSSMGRDLCMAKIEVCRGTSLIVANSHLESPTKAPVANSHLESPTKAPPTFQMNSEERVAQAKEAINILESSPNVIFSGDMNWDDETDGKFPLLPGWVDAWAELRPWVKGWTYDTKSNQMLVANRPLQKRLDRFICKLEDFKLEKISMIGTEAIPGVSYTKEKRVGNRIHTLELPVLPSDHYGLILEVHSK